MAVKLTKRKGFNFFRSYYDVYNELESDSDKVAFMNALFDRQFLGIKPTNLKGMAKFAYISQTNSIDSQVKGYNDKMTKLGKPLIGNDLPPTYGGQTPPTEQVQEKVQEKVQVEEEQQEQEKEEVQEKKTTLLSEIKISDLEDNQIEHFEIAKAYQQLFIKNLKEKDAPTKNQENAKYKDYVDPIRLMMTKDGATKTQLTKVFKFLGSPEGDFWKPNVLSTKKLREKFSQLLIKSQTPGINGKQKDTRTNQQIAADAFNSETARKFKFK